jgi:RNA polymerase sigma factor (sigma-70 family)
MEEDRKLNPETDDFLNIFHRTKKKIYNFVLKMTFDRMLTEDIVQDVYMKFFVSIDRLKSFSSAEIWLFTTARNEIYQYYRKKKIHIDKFNPVDIDNVDIISDESIEDKLEREDIRNHLNEQLMFMPAEQKEVFLLKEYGGFSYKEISEMMNIDIELVKSRLHKVRKKIIDRISRIIN